MSGSSSLSSVSDDPTKSMMEDEDVNQGLADNFDDSLCGLGTDIASVSCSNLKIYRTVNHGFLYYTRTDFMPFAESQKRPKFIRCSCIQFTAH